MEEEEEEERKRREGERETGRTRCVTSGACRFTVCAPLLSRQQPEHTAYSNLHRWPTATFKYVIFNNHCIGRYGLGRNAEKKGMSEVSLMPSEVFYLGNIYTLGNIKLKAGIWICSVYILCFV